MTDASPTEVLTGCRRLVLSPHLDDGVLSCGGAITHWAQANDRPVVITIFAGWPPGPLSDFARFQHERWSADEDIVALRRAEDRAALARLRATPLWLDYADCIYRGERYTTEGSLFGPVASDESHLEDELATDLLGLWRLTDRATVYVPLALGHHVDHQLTHAAAAGLSHAGVVVRWYEDFPYAARPGGTDHLRGATEALLPEVVDIETVLDDKIAAIACYQSQIPVLFGAAQAMPQAVRNYGRVVGGGQAAERFWRSGQEHG